MTLKDPRLESSWIGIECPVMNDRNGVQDNAILENLYECPHQHLSRLFLQVSPLLIVWDGCMRESPMSNTLRITSIKVSQIKFKFQKFLRKQNVAKSPQARHVDPLWCAWGQAENKNHFGKNSPAQSVRCLDSPLISTPSPWQKLTPHPSPLSPQEGLSRTERKTKHNQFNYWRDTLCCPPDSAVDWRSEPECPA